ncbi:hypothetical protein BD413DRAFT_680538 [Trametes elegans]|nr:hypothetical protein BD413DRAFT_680538 [Trametes elegans]
MLVGVVAKKVCVAGGCAGHGQCVSICAQLLLCSDLTVAVGQWEDGQSPWELVVVKEQETGATRPRTWFRCHIGIKDQRAGACRHRSRVWISILSHPRRARRRGVANPLRPRASSSEWTTMGMVDVTLSVVYFRHTK